MTTRNRIIYQSEALFVSAITGSGDDTGAIPASEVSELHRIQSVDFDETIERTDVNELGKLAALDRIILTQPVVPLNFNYLLADGYNETGVGFDAYSHTAAMIATGDLTTGGTNLISNILAGTDLVSEKNFYLVTVPEGNDADGYTMQSTDNAIFGFGNAFLSSYTVSAEVGGLPNATLAVECQNLDISYNTAQGFTNPAIKTTGNAPEQYTGKVLLPAANTGTLSVVALRPGDITIEFGSANNELGGAVLPGSTDASSKQAMHIQSFSLEVPLSRVAQERLGNTFAFSREIEVPINCTLSVTANLGDISEGSLQEIICGATTERNITIRLKDPCGGTTDGNMAFSLRGATFDGQSFSSSIGPNKSVDLTFVSQVGGANDTTKGVFLFKKS